MSDSSVYPLDCGSWRRLSERYGSKETAAVEWMDRSLNWCFGFFHDEAVLCAREAARADPAWCFPYAVIAHARAPNYNNAEFEADDVEEAKQAIAEGQTKTGGTGVEKQFLAAQAARYAAVDFSDCSKAAQCYKEKMEALFAVAPDDTEVATFLVEALLQIHPWRLYDKEGNPKAEAVRARVVIMDGLGRDSKHPGLIHFFIHLVEMSPNPAEGLPSANFFREPVSYVGDNSHLFHMPSHLDVLVGAYRDAIEANKKAIERDRKVVAVRGPKGFFTLYRLHNRHLLIYAALMAGCKEEALAAARDIYDELTTEMVAPLPDWLEAFKGVYLEVLIRFGMWDPILKVEPPEDPELFCSFAASRHYARGIAFAALSDVSKAREESALFETAVSKVPSSRVLFNNSMADIFGIAREMLKGETDYRAGEFESAFAALNRAVERDDGLVYDEPWAWMVPVRNALGALLLEQNRVEEARKVYEEDLKRHPLNVWSSHGLRECEETMGEQPTIEMPTTADVKIVASCFCRLSKCC
uniref:Uncharacterized protein n=1 Tax=Chromera velia CCMP2878 TaxID=1169474 RepID=A0A0G4I7C2_9ALVE|eukprot:Cvel_11553.t1-p1 / transcript=Cvel_11553.t1 / gene=Cvel_11553 / organism=Chromera_velia_CCMP2878 / gene_product=hypothetical protein / transcript_product=hypothetical protein / location=Cvel_scaffold730:5087-6664(-) / protein_length=526 / sequence_SO=supercontig / SO=protein_coding / is_pseudo=false